MASYLPNTMHNYWEFIDAASKGNLKECKSNAPKEEEYQNMKELMSTAYTMALRVAMSGSHDDVVEWLLNSMSFDRYEDISTVLDFVSRNQKMLLFMKIQDTIQRLGSDETLEARAFAKAGHVLIDLEENESLLITLIEAVRHDHREMVTTIMSRLRSTDLKVQTGRMLMLFSAYKDQPNILKLVYQKTVDAHEEDWWHGQILTPLYLAAKSGSRGCSLLALEYWGSHVDVNALYFPERFTALHVASYYGHEDVVSLLLQQSGINLLVKDVLGRTPLHYASGQGHLSVVLQLLQKLGPLDDNLCDDNGISPLEMAVCGGHTIVVRELLHNRSRFYATKDYPFQNVNSFFNFQQLSPDISISQVNNSISATYLKIAELYEPPNLIDSIFWSPGAFTSLHFATSSPESEGQSEVLKQLIKFYCEKELDEVLLLKDNMGFTAYDWAQARGLGEDFLMCVKACKGKEFVDEFAKKAGSKMSQAALDLSKEIDRFEHRKIEMKWCMDICRALREHDMVVARILVYQVESRKFKISCFGQSISQALMLHIFPGLDDLSPGSAAKVLFRKCMMDGTCKKDIEEFMVHLCQVAEFPRDVLERWLQAAIVFGFDNLAYHLIVRDKVNCNTAIDISFLMTGRARKNIPSNGLLSPFKSAVKFKQQRMQRWMVERDDVKRGLYEDRQVYVDYANTILVGAVLIAGVAYQGWLQPPSGFDDDGYVLVDQHRLTLQFFWWLNSISFFLAVATVIAAGVGAMPSSSNQHLVDAVRRVHSAVSVASVLFPMSMVCIMAAFAAAGFTILPHHRHRYQVIMMVTVSCGSFLCSLILVWFIKRFFDLNPNLKSAQMIKKTIHKFGKKSFILIFSYIYIAYLGCIGLLLCLIAAPLLLVKELSKLCACSYMEGATHTALYSIKNTWINANITSWRRKYIFASKN